MAGRSPLSSDSAELSQNPVLDDACDPGHAYPDDEAEDSANPATHIGRKMMSKQFLVYRHFAAETRSNEREMPFCTP